MKIGSSSLEHTLHEKLQKWTIYHSKTYFTDSTQHNVAATKYLQIFASKARDSSRDIVPSPNLRMAWSPEHDEGHRVGVECVPEEDPALVSCGGHCTLPHAGVKLCGGCLKEDIDGRLSN